MATETREGFRFSERTSNNLKALIEMGLVRNKTEAIDMALEHLVTEEKTKRDYVRELKARGVFGDKGPGSGYEPTVMSMADIIGVNQQARA